MIVNIYVNMGEENAAKKGDIWSRWSYGHAGKIAPDMERLYTHIVYIYNFS